MFKNSVIDLKRDLRGSLVDLADEEAALRAVERLEGFGASLQVVGLVNDPAVTVSIPRGRAMVLSVDELRSDIGAMFEHLERMSHRAPAVLVMPFGRASGKSLLSRSADALAALMSSHWAEESPHPGERHRQVTRRVKSSRSRAGKAGRWQ